MPKSRSRSRSRSRTNQTTLPVSPTSDEELVAELREYGESVNHPIKSDDKRHILVKKLNHFRARENQHARNRFSSQNSRQSRSTSKDSPYQRWKNKRTAMLGAQNGDGPSWSTERYTYSPNSDMTHTRNSTTVHNVAGQHSESLFVELLPYLLFAGFFLVVVYMVGQNGTRSIPASVAYYKATLLSYISTVLQIIIVLCIAAAVVYGIYVYRRRRRSRQEKDEDAVFLLVDDIIQLLQNKYQQVVAKETDPEVTSFLVVQHVRDQLIPPCRRSEMMPVWEKAVEFIARYESRIHMETKMIHGDEFDVWVWLPQQVQGDLSEQCVCGL